MMTSKPSLASATLSYTKGWLSGLLIFLSDKEIIRLCRTKSEFYRQDLPNIPLISPYPANRLLKTCNLKWINLFLDKNVTDKDPGFDHQTLVQYPNLKSIAIVSTLCNSVTISMLLSSLPTQKLLKLKLEDDRRKCHFKGEYPKNLLLNNLSMLNNLKSLHLGNFHVSRDFLRLLLPNLDQIEDLSLQFCNNLCQHQRIPEEVIQSESAALLHFLSCSVSLKRLILSEFIYPISLWTLLDALTPESQLIELDFLCYKYEENPQLEENYYKLSGRKFGQISKLTIRNCYYFPIFLMSQLKVLNIPQERCDWLLSTKFIQDQIFPLEVLMFDSFSLQVSDISKLESILSRCPSLTHLEIKNDKRSHFGLGCKYWISLFRCLRNHCKSLTQLELGDFGGMPNDEDQFNFNLEFSKFLAAQPSLTHLNLHRFDFVGDLILLTLAKGFRNRSLKLQNLILSGNSFSDTGICVLADALRIDKCSLRALNLSDCTEIGQLGFLSISRMLFVNKSITNLNLNGILEEKDFKFVECMEYVCDAMLQNSTLRRIQVNCSTTSEACIRAMKKLSARSLREIEASQSKMQKSICDFIKRFKEKQIKTPLFHRISEFQLFSDEYVVIDKLDEVVRLTCMI